MGRKETVMNYKEFGSFAAALKTYYPKDNLLPNEQAIELWYAALRDLPYEVASNALMILVQSSKFPPSIAEIREAAAKLIHGETKDWSKAWEEACRAMSRFGRDRKSLAYETLDELTREVVDRLGYRNLCMSENVASDRANFRTIYTELAERRTETSKLSPQIQALIGGGHALLGE